MPTRQFAICLVPKVRLWECRFAGKLRFVAGVAWKTRTTLVALDAMELPTQVFPKLYPVNRVEGFKPALY